MIGNKAAVGDAEEKFNLEEVQFGGRGLTQTLDLLTLLALQKQIRSLEAQSPCLPALPRRKENAGMQTKREKQNGIFS